MLCCCCLHHHLWPFHSLQADDATFRRLAAVCLHSVLQSAVDLPKPAPSLQEICTALDCSGSAEEAEAMLQEVKAALKADMASTSVSARASCTGCA